MSLHTIINCSLIFAGAVIMLVSIVKLKGPMEALSFVPESQRRTVSLYLGLHRTLMIFFLGGYLVVLAGFAFNYSFISGAFVGLIFLSGAVFVYIGIVVQSRLLSEMQKTLQGVLPICCKCKKIRFVNADPEDPKTWKGIEEFISEKTKVGFTHGYCPECFQKEMKEIDNYR